MDFLDKYYKTSGLDFLNMKQNNIFNLFEEYFDVFIKVIKDKCMFEENKKNSQKQKEDKQKQKEEQSSEKK